MLAPIPPDLHKEGSFQALLAAFERMPDSVDIDAVLLLMEHFLEVHHKQTDILIARLTDLARGIGVEHFVGESPDALVERVRKIARGEFPDETPTNPDIHLKPT
jgi:hypothetical protein